MSAVDRFWATVMTCTWLFVMSGVESTLIVLMAHSPPAMMTTTRRHTISLWLMEKSMIFLIIFQ